MKRPISGTLLALSTALYALLWLGVLLVEITLKMSKEQALSFEENFLGDYLLRLALSVPLLVVALFFGIALAATVGTWRGGALGRAALAFGLILDIVLFTMAILVYSTGIEELLILKDLVHLPLLIGLGLFGLLRLILFAVSLRHPFYPKAVE